MIANFPGSVVVYILVIRNGNSLSEVNHPDRSSLLVVDEEQGAADQLMVSKE